MEKPAFTRANLSNIKAIMAIMCFPMVELLCQTLMGWILVPKYLLSGVHGRLWSCPIMAGIKCWHFPRIRLQWCLPGTETPEVQLPG
jgi:hypothetical protein